MKILKNKKIVISRLYDSDDYNGQYEQKHIELADGKILSFTPDNSNFKYLKILFSTLGSSEKERIIKEGRFLSKPPAYYKDLMKESDYENLQLDYYATEPHLALKYSIIENHLVVITIGEKQPGRWIVVIEGVWEVSN